MCPGEHEEQHSKTIITATAAGGSPLTPRHQGGCEGRSEEVNIADPTLSSWQELDMKELGVREMWALFSDSKKGDIAVPLSPASWGCSVHVFGKYLLNTCHVDLCVPSTKMHRERWGCEPLFFVEAANQQILFFQKWGWGLDEQKTRGLFISGSQGKLL